MTSRDDERVRQGGHAAKLSEPELMDFLRDPAPALYLAPDAHETWKLWKDRRGVRCAHCDVVVVTQHGVVLPGDMIQMEEDSPALKAGSDPLYCSVCERLPGAHS